MNCVIRKGMQNKKKYDFILLCNKLFKNYIFMVQYLIDFYNYIMLVFMINLIFFYCFVLI